MWPWQELLLCTIEIYLNRVLNKITLLVVHRNCKFFRNSKVTTNKKDSLKLSFEEYYNSISTYLTFSTGASSKFAVSSAGK